MDNRDISYHTYLAKRILFTEAITFAIGAVIIRVEPIAGVYFFAVWFMLVAVINVADIFALVLRKPKGYWYYVAALLLLPLLLATFLFLFLAI